MSSPTGGTAPEAGPRHNFICGVVEGFYGRPWTTEQRKDLFQKMKKWGMDSYVYAPKDDYKHRAYWRELYTVEEAEHLTGLINAAKAQGVTFYYALSPGLDITYSNQKEITALKRKLEQVSQFGCTAFALLFDDIEPEMSEADKDIFQSFAHAQVSVTNDIQQHLGGAAVRFLLCPTQYCGTRALPTVSSSEYLSTLGSKLSSDIDIMWTGPKVISKILTPTCIEEITRVLRRPPVIWDNLHANDYDQKRMFLGPYSGRSPELIPLLRGVLSNPNCEYNANTVPIRTLAHWANCCVDATTNISADIKLEQEGVNNENEDEASACFNQHVYHHRKALRSAVTEWLPEFSIEKEASGPIIKPQPIVNVATIPIIPIMPSVNTCMSLTTTTSTASSSSGTTTTNSIPTVNTSQLQALADVCTTLSSTENFIPPSNPIMNSLASPTKVITNELIPNPIPPLVTSNIALPSEIPVSTIPVAIMGLKALENNILLHSMSSENHSTNEEIKSGSDSPMLELSMEATSKTTDIDSDVSTESDKVVTINEIDESGVNKENGCSLDIINSENVNCNENDITYSDDFKDKTDDTGEDIHTEIIVDYCNEKDDDKGLINGAMSVEDSPCTLSPQHVPEIAMEYTPDQENSPIDIESQNIENKSDNKEQMNGNSNENSNEDIDVVMAEECTENGIMQIEPIASPSNNEMVVEAVDIHENCEKKLTNDKLTVEDLMLLCDLFYLPFEHGSQALKLLQEFNWLKCNAPVLIGYSKNSLHNLKNGVINKSDYQEWHDRAQKFGSLCECVSQLARRLSSVNNRELLHDICGYVWDLRAVVGLLYAYVKWLALGKFPPNICHYTQGSYTWFSKGWKEAFMSGDQEPWVFRGGLTADLQRLIPIDNGNDLLAYRLPTSPTSELYTIRPYQESDKKMIYKLCWKTCCDGSDCTEFFPVDLEFLPGDKLIGAYLSLMPELCMVMENDCGNIMGFVCATTDSRIFQRRKEREWAPHMRRKYPPKLINAQSTLNTLAKSYVQSFYQFKYVLSDTVHRYHSAEMCCYISPDNADHSAPKRLITCLLAALRASGSFGAHVCISSSDHNFNQFYTKLGFIEIHHDNVNNNIYLGRTF